MLKKMLRGHKANEKSFLSALILMIDQNQNDTGVLIITNLEKYNRIFIDVLGVSEDVLGESFTFKDVPQWDSVAHLSLISELEDSFDVMFEPEDILHYGSYENGKKILERYGVII